MKWVIIIIIAFICSFIGFSIGHPVVIFSMGVVAGAVNVLIIDS